MNYVYDLSPQSMLFIGVVEGFDVRNGFSSLTYYCGSVKTRYTCGLNCLVNKTDIW